MAELGLGAGPGGIDSIGSISGSAGAHLNDVDELLHDFLGELVALLNADTAAVLLLDKAGTHVVPRATYGIEEEVRQGVRIPLGIGFAGRIASERQPVILNRVDSTTVSNPILWQKGIKRILGVPLEGGSRLLGVLHIGRTGEESFTEQDTALLEFVAARAAAAIQARQLEVERSAGKILQRSLLPANLPDCVGMEFATRYLPAELGGVGGDWYDTFIHPDGDLWVMVGDVAGHGLEAAVSMGRLRSALRAYALEGHPPEEVLALGDRKLQFFDNGQMATVFLAVLTPPFDVATVALAGHPPPVIAEPGGSAYFIDAPVSPPLGTTDLTPRSAVIEMPLGAVLLAYTDGLVERRGETLDVGLERLRTCVTADEPETVCRQVMQRLIGKGPSEDDIAVLAFRRTV
ncbi:MAG: GAF domain-containing SpoIIE family protein phosphatase [Microthrixaceae bacterium]